MALMRLRIPGGWIISKNDFEDIDSEIDPESEGSIKNWYYFIEDILQIVQSHLNDNGEFYSPTENCWILDLGWYPEGNPTGQYKLCLVWLDQDKCWNIIDEKVTKDRNEIRDSLEFWLQDLNENYQKYIKLKDTI